MSEMTPKPSIEPLCEHMRPMSKICHPCGRTTVVTYKPKPSIDSRIAEIENRTCYDSQDQYDRLTDAFDLVREMRVSHIAELAVREFEHNTKISDLQARIETLEIALSKSEAFDVPHELFEARQRLAEQARQIAELKTENDRMTFALTESKEWEKLHFEALVKISEQERQIAASQDAHCRDNQKSDEYYRKSQQQIAELQAAITKFHEETYSELAAVFPNVGLCSTTKHAVKVAAIAGKEQERQIADLKAERDTYKHAAERIGKELDATVDEVGQLQAQIDQEREWVAEYKRSEAANQALCDEVTVAKIRQLQSDLAAAREQFVARVDASNDHDRKLKGRIAELEQEFSKAKAELKARGYQ